LERVLEDLAWSSYLRALRLKRRSDATVRDYGYTYRTLTEWAGKPAELRTLTVEAIDLRNDLLSLAGKTGRRNIPLGDVTAVAYERYLRARAKHRYADLDALWLGKKGQLTRTGIQMMLARRVKRRASTGGSTPTCSGTLPPQRRRTPGFPPKSWSSCTAGLLARP
jgi:hypothetical protein